MLKPSKTFVLSKSTKRMLANFVNPHERGAWKRAMIDAELASKVVIKPEKKDRNQRGNSNYQVTETSAVSVE